MAPGAAGDTTEPLRIQNRAGAYRIDRPALERDRDKSQKTTNQTGMPQRNTAATTLLKNLTLLQRYAASLYMNNNETAETQEQDQAQQPQDDANTSKHDHIPNSLLAMFKRRNEFAEALGISTERDEAIQRRVRIWRLEYGELPKVHQTIEEDTEHLLSTRERGYAHFINGVLAEQSKMTRMSPVEAILNSLR